MALRIIPRLGRGFRSDCATAHVIDFLLGELSNVYVHDARLPYGVRDELPGYADRPDSLSG